MNFMITLKKDFDNIALRSNNSAKLKKRIEDYDKIGECGPLLNEYLIKI